MFLFLSLWLSLCSTEEPNEQRHAYYVVLNVRIGSVKHSNEMKNILSLFYFFLCFCFLGPCGFLPSLQLTVQCKVTRARRKEQANWRYNKKELKTQPYASCIEM